MTKELAGQTIGDGHCVAYVRLAAGLPRTSAWRRGVKVRDARPPLETLTPIATFGGDPPRYQNRTDGSSHAAILIEAQAEGLLVWDQWRGRVDEDGKPVGVAWRIIRYRRGAGLPVNDGDAYYQIETIPVGGEDA
jgi:hypothetical protein